MIGPLTAALGVPLALAIAGAGGPPSPGMLTAEGAPAKSTSDTIPPLFDPENVRTEDAAVNPGSRAPLQGDPFFTMEFDARIQVRHTQADPHDAPRTGSTGIRRGRLGVSGEAYEAFDYRIQLELSGGSVQLIDANVEYALSPYLVLWVGQGKAPFGRQQLVSSAELQFVDRTIVDDRFAAKRQQGIRLRGRAAEERLEYAAGVYDGLGINRNENPGNRFLWVGRIVVTPLGRYDPVESAHDEVDGPRAAFGAAALRNTLPADEARPDRELTRFNAESAFRTGGFTLTGELYREWADPLPGDRIVTDGWHLQVGYLLPGGTHEVGARSAAIRSDGPLLLDDRTEVGIVYGLYFREHRAKVQTDLRNIRTGATGEDHRELRVQFQLGL